MNRGTPRRAGLLSLLLAATLAPAAVYAADAASPGAAGDLDGDWLLTSDLYGKPFPLRLRLSHEGDKVSGTLGGQKLSGTRTASGLRFVITSDENPPNDVTTYEATVEGQTLRGSWSDNNSPPVRATFTARRIPPRPSGPPRHHVFKPTSWSREFSVTRPPVLTIAPGDSVRTTTVDAGGTDETGARITLGGNPQTGPFYVTGAMPGDLLAIHFNRIRLNRDFAASDDAVVGRALGPDFAVKMKDVGKSIIWQLDRAKMVGRPKGASGHLKGYTVPLKPMLGCVATAPGSFSAAPGTGDSGAFGGNMDFNGVVEGNTVYLPVRQPGALLYIGDGHAAQGDGELTGDALETSMDVEFTVDVLPEKSTSAPRVESPTQIMVVGLSGTLDDAMRIALAGLAEWLEQGWHLTPSEIAQVLGSAVQLQVGEVADRNASVVARLDKARLATLTRDPPAKGAAAK